MPRRRKNKLPSPSRNRTDSDDQKDLDRRIFIGNLPTEVMSYQDMQDLFSKYGKISDINKAAERRNMYKAPSRPSPPRREFYGYGDSLEPRRDRSPLRSSPRRDSREPKERDLRSIRDSRDGQEPRNFRDHKDFRDTRDGVFRDGHSSRDARDLRDGRDPRDYRDPRDSKDLRDTRDIRIRDAPRDTRESLYDRYREVRDTKNSYRVDNDDYYQKREDYSDRYREQLDQQPDDRFKREERRREELYRQYFDELQKKADQDRRVECSVIVGSKQSKEYAESVGRKVRDLGMLVDLIFLNTDVSLAQVLEDVTRGGTPFAIVISQQHQTHRSCTVNILFGTPQEHRNMPLADAMVLVARNYERYKVEKCDKDREDVARQAAKMSTDAILRERSGALDEGIRAPPPPGIMTLFNLLADNRYITTEEIDKVILYLRDRKERILALSGEPSTSQLSRPLGASSGPSHEGSLTLANNQTIQMTQPLTSGPSTAQTPSKSQQELQAKILSLFNSGVASSIVSSNPSTSGATTTPGQNYGTTASIQRSAAQMDVASLGSSVQRPQSLVNQHPSPLTQGEGVRSAASRPVPAVQMQNMYGQLRPQAPNNAPNQRPVASVGINFDNPSVQKALDTLIQSGPALSHFVSQTTAQAVRSGPPQQPSMVSYPRHY
ncbi:nuclear receptor coactivator 5 isoform X2 [Phyllobates terribilis]|uniref:nuclear receptor coactivator 5 isoform X2 n=1 Tax=Phyllobates terribilis TaxID=111132 RepID=UPI003CCB125B